MNGNKIAFFKSLAPMDSKFPLRIRDDPKYDNHPLVNKEAVDEALNEYDDKLQYSKKRDLLDISDLHLNIEGRFLAENIPEIPSIVIDEICTKKNLQKTLNKHDITHIGLSTYASGMDRTIELIKLILSNYKDIELFIGGVGTLYPHLHDLVKPKNICIGNGVNWLRDKFNLKPISTNDYIIPYISGNFPGFPVPIETVYLISQIGCPYKCDFCITNNMLEFTPFSNYEKIINFFEDLNAKSSKDIFLFINEPNAFFPEHTWKKIFNYFIKNQKEFDKNLFIAFDGSLNHINKFDLEIIQHKSPIKFILISYGIESTLEGGYLKNKGDPKEIIERLNKLGIITKQNYIIGLPFHTKKNIEIEIQNNLKFNPDIYAIGNFIPIPHTPLYNQLKSQGRLYDRSLPPEFLYAYGFQPFNHENLGGGFNVLKHLLKALYKSEEKLIDIFGNFVNKLLDIYSISNSQIIKWIVKILMSLNKQYYSSFHASMPSHVELKYKNNIQKTKLRYKYLKKQKINNPLNANP